MLPKIHITIEKWKFNKNYNIYVSNMGNFKDKNKNSIRLLVEKRGYLQVPICNNKRGIIKYIQAHRAVMETWCPRADMWKEKLTVDHLDHNKRNNKTNNLEWVTAQENLKRAAADLLGDDKDGLIQSLQYKLRTLEIELERYKSNKLVITAVNTKNFYSWQEVKDFLDQKDSSYKNTKLINLEKNVLKSYRNNTKYMGYNWKVINY